MGHDATTNMQRELSISTIKLYGALAVASKPGDKKLVGTAKDNTKDKSNLLLQTLANSDKGIGIHLVNNVVDVDIDSDDPYVRDAFEYFLPPTPFVWGRESRPRTHRLYKVQGSDFLPKAHPVLRSIEKNKQIAVELRGGEIATAQHTMMPGSKHPSGELYTWADAHAVASAIGSGESLSTITDTNLVNAYRFAAVAALIAPYWIDGVRNDISMCLAGLFYGISQIPLDPAAAVLEDGEEAPAGAGYVLTQDHAEIMLEGICAITGDADDSRKQTLLNTWRKAERGALVVGGGRLNELCDNKGLTSAIRLFLTEDQVSRELAAFADQYAKIRNKVEVIDLDAHKTGIGGHLMTFGDFRQITSPFGGLFGKKYKRFADMFITSKQSLTLDGHTFDPSKGQLCPNEMGQGTYLNHWHGFHIEPWAMPVERKTVQRFVRHVEEIICSNDPEVMEWVWQWLGSIVSSPGTKSGTALVLVGIPGCGKSSLGSKIFDPIIGFRHMTTTNSISSMVTGFNSGFQAKVFIQCDEAAGGGTGLLEANQLKAFITDKTYGFTAKGKDTNTMPNAARVLFTANDEKNALNLMDGERDRRYSILKVNPKYAKNVEFWGDYFDWLEKPDVLAKIHRFLKDIKVTSLIRLPLKTKAKKAMQAQSVDAEIKWLAAVVARKHPLPESLHKYWFQAPVGKKATPAERGSATILRRWPKNVELALMYEDLKRSTARKDHHTLPPTMNGFAKILRDADLLMSSKNPQRMAVSYTEPHANAATSKTVSLTYIKPLAEWRRYLVEHQGMAFDDLADDDDKEGEGVQEGPDPAAHAKEEF